MLDLTANLALFQKLMKLDTAIFCVQHSGISSMSQLVSCGIHILCLHTGVLLLCNHAAHNSNTFKTFVQWPMNLCIHTHCTCLTINRKLVLQCSSQRENKSRSVNLNIRVYLWSHSCHHIKQNLLLRLEPCIMYISGIF